MNGYEGPIDGSIKRLKRAFCQTSFNVAVPILKTSAVRDSCDEGGQVNGLWDPVGQWHRCPGYHWWVTGLLRGQPFRRRGLTSPSLEFRGRLTMTCQGTDYTIGFDSVINTAIEAVDKIRDTADSTTGSFCRSDGTTFRLYRHVYRYRQRSRQRIGSRSRYQHRWSGKDTQTGTEAGQIVFYHHSCRRQSVGQCSWCSEQSTLNISRMSMPRLPLSAISSEADLHHARTVSWAVDLGMLPSMDWCMASRVLWQELSTTRLFSRLSRKRWHNPRYLPMTFIKLANILRI